MRLHDMIRMVDEAAADKTGRKRADSLKLLTEMTKDTQCPHCQTLGCPWLTGGECSPKVKNQLPSVFGESSESVD